MAAGFGFSARTWTSDSGLGTRDSGLGTRDSGLGTRDSGLGRPASHAQRARLRPPGPGRPCGASRTAGRWADSR
ncbi:hypothetical protein C6P78_04780 [Burkholderia multivorans]|nr:hypothetical protein C6P78_04780 [Burkholderia multivorans]